VFGKQESYTPPHPEKLMSGSKRKISPMIDPPKKKKKINSTSTADGCIKTQWEKATVMQ
jgi:hypothetical protein